MPEPSARILLGKADVGYKTLGRVYARVELRRPSSFGSDPREQETTDHRTVVDPIEFSITFDLVGPNGQDVGGGAMGQTGIDAVVIPAASPEIFARLARLIPWHLNGMQGACDHQVVEYETDRYGRRVPSLALTPACPVTGYRYGHAWLVRELPPEIIADAVAMGATIPPDRSDPAVIMAEAE